MYASCAGFWFSGKWSFGKTSESSCAVFATIIEKLNSFANNACTGSVLKHSLSLSKHRICVGDSANRRFPLLWCCKSTEDDWLLFNSAANSERTQTFSRGRDFSWIKCQHAMDFKDIQIFASNLHELKNNTANNWGIQTVIYLWV